MASGYYLHHTEAARSTAPVSSDLIYG